MIVLHPNQEQYNTLNNYKNNSSQLIFVKDGNDKWIVGVEVLNDINFKLIHKQLNELEQIKFIQKIEVNNPKHTFAGY
jgi:hypothetical protein